MTRTVSVSELLLYHDCERAWKYRYHDRLVKVSQGRNPAMASGTAVHYVVEHQTTERPGEMLRQDDARALATECLNDEFRNLEYPDAEKTKAQVEKYLPGVVRAVGKIPEDVWAQSWHVEWDLDTTLYTPTSGDEGVHLIGRPDLWTMNDGVLEVLDVKTTKTDPMTYMLWFPQIRYYAMMLQDMYPEFVVQYRYLCVPTTGDKPAPQSPAWIFTPKQVRRAREEVERLLSRMDPEMTEMRALRRCDWCEFKTLCTLDITGGDPMSLAKEEFATRLSREEREKQVYKD